MAGPNPYPPYSFLESRKFSGKSWLVCEGCRRYTPLILDDDRRDTRFTTFSCSRCGGEGKRVFEDPHKAGLEPDLRPRPMHHPLAAARLRAFAIAAREEEAARQRALREAAWRRAQRPKPEARPTYVLKPFPVQTFADIALWGLEASVYCRECRRTVPLDVGDNLAPLPLFTTRLRCTGMRTAGLLEPRPCGCRGRIDLVPAANGGLVPSEAFLSVCCHAIEHTTIEASWLLHGRLPWWGILANGEKFGCQGCRRPMAHTWHAAGSRSR